MNINNIINYRFKDPLFVYKIKALRNLNNKLGLSNRVSKEDNIKQILKELIEKYHYVGVYDTNFISEFIKIWTDAFFGEETLEGTIAQIKLNDLEQKPEQYNELITIDAPRYMMDENGYKRLHNKEYLADVERRAKEQYKQDISLEVARSDIPLEVARSDIEILNMTNDSQDSEIKDVQSKILPINKDMTEAFPKFAESQLLNSRFDNLRRKSIATIEKLNSLSPQEYNALIEQIHQKRDKRVAVPNTKTKKVKFGNVGMDDLIKVVAQLKQDVKQIRDAQSVPSAQAWIERNNYGNVLEAVEEDLDGDNYPEIVVKSKLTNKPVIVNGYTTTPSLFPYRNLYYHKYPTAAARKGKSLRNYLQNEWFNPTYTDDGKVDEWSKEAQDFNTHLTEKGFTKLLKPNNRTYYQLFTQKCITPFYTALKYLNHKVPFKLTKLASYIWNQIVINPAFTHIYGEEAVQNLSPEDAKNLRNQPEIKEAINDIVKQYLTNPYSMFTDILPIIVDIWRKEGFTMTAEQVGDFVLVSRAIMSGADAPLRENYTTWKADVLKNNPENVNELIATIIEMFE